MCARYSLVPDQAKFPEFFPLDAPPEPRVNIAPMTDCLVQTASGPMRFRWGLVPAWADSERVGSKMINARSETVAEKPAFRAAFRHRRCLIPASSFFEWKETDAPPEETEQGSLFGDAPARSSSKRPFLIRDREEKPLLFAGLWEEWRGYGEPLRTFTMLTTVPNREMAELHVRMPVILPPEHWDMWLDRDYARTEPLLELLQPLPDDSLEFYPVTARVGNPRYQAPDALTPCTTAAC